MIQVRVRAWAKSRGIDPKLLVRDDPEEDQYLVDGVPWTIPFGQWIRKKWDEWWKMCPDPYNKSCNHCWNQTAFNEWLEKG